MNRPISESPSPQPSSAARAGLRTAISYKVASAALLAVMFGLIKDLGNEYPIGQIVFARSLFALIPIVCLLRMLGGWRLLRTQHLMMHIRRSAFGITSLFLSFTAVTLLPLATATALTYTAPFFIAGFSVVALGESMSARRWISLLLGFAGVLLIVRPDIGGGIQVDAIGVTVALLGALATAAALISIRSMAATESGVAIAFYFAVFGSLVGAASLIFAFVPPRWEDVASWIAIGLLGGVAQILLTFAYHKAPASVIAPFEYATLVFATLVGYLFWNELPNGLDLLGIFIIVGANLALIVRAPKTSRTARTGGRAASARDRPKR